jgi:hypothetical protein
MSEIAVAIFTVVRTHQRQFKTGGESDGFVANFGTVNKF